MGITSMLLLEMGWEGMTLVYGKIERKDRTDWDLGRGIFGMREERFKMHQGRHVT